MRRLAACLFAAVTILVLPACHSDPFGLEPEVDVAVPETPSEDEDAAPEITAPDQ